MTHVIVDCDGVLLKWEDGFRAYLLAKFGWPPEQIDPAGPDNWSLGKWLGLPEVTIRELNVEFNTSEKFEELAVYEGVRNALYHIRDAGHLITILTSCGVTSATVAMRKRNLRYILGEKDEIICLPLGTSKGDWLHEYDPGVYVEDNYDHAQKGVLCGHKCFVLRRSHNRHQEKTCLGNVQWIDNWLPIVSLLT